MVLVATQVKRRRGTTAENDAFTGAEGEITVDLTRKELRVHDGIQQGGYRCVKIDNHGDISAPNNLLSNNGITVINGHVERGVAPSEATFKDIRYQDKYGKWLAGFEHHVDIAKTSELSIIISDMLNDTSNIAGSILLGQNSDGSIYTSCPSSLLNNSILTTVAHDYYSEGGWVELGNRLLIQWGRVQGKGYPSSQWISFSRAFANTDYCVSLTPQNAGNNYSQSAYVYGSLYTTGFDVRTAQNATDPQDIWCNWIAVGIR